MSLDVMVAVCWLERCTSASGDFSRVTKTRTRTCSRGTGAVTEKPYSERQLAKTGNSASADDLGSARRANKPTIPIAGSQPAIVVITNFSSSNNLLSNYSTSRLPLLFKLEVCSITGLWNSALE